MGIDSRSHYSMNITIDVLRVGMIPFSSGFIICIHGACERVVVTCKAYDLVAYVAPQMGEAPFGVLDVGPSDGGWPRLCGSKSHANFWVTRRMVYLV